MEAISTKIQPSAVVAVRDLEFGWRKSETVLSVARLDIQAGEKVLIRGASGAGKSTLLSLLAGILLPRRGSVSLLGQTLTRLPGSARDGLRAEHLGIIFQMFNLLPYLSVVDNVLLPCRFSRRRAERARHTDGSEVAAANRLLGELGIPAETRRSVAELSIGQQQRVAAARALIGSPEIVLADEPTSALDADNRGAFLKLLRQECDQTGATLLMVSHDASLAGYFDRVITMAELGAAS